MSVLLVDWLGRGGIAQTTEAWALELAAAGEAVEIVTRPGRELSESPVAVVAAPSASGRFTAHRAVVDAATRRIRERRPSVVVVQNYVVPALERRVFAAARETGARVVQVVHNHRVHTWRAGSRAGMARRLRAADVVVAHSEYVARGVRSYSGRDDVVVTPLPAPIGMLQQVAPGLSAEGRASLLRCGHFGALHRGYKGTDTVAALAADPPEGWSFVVAGVGAPATTPRLEAVSRFLDPAELTALVNATDATLVPYRSATQSAVVVLAHVLGSPPIASAVGGVPEQIDDGIDGLLVSRDAPLGAWRDALRAMSDDDFRKELAVSGTERAWRDHERFVRTAVETVR
jgi:glycosyltransferase involved in cell wall biosynthesis